jgi:Protein of unknown function (DUF2490)
MWLMERFAFYSLRTIQKLAFILIISLNLPTLAFSQEDRVGNWLMYFGMNRVSDKFSIHSEMQYRNHTIAPVNTEQLLLRTGVNFHFSKSAFTSIGYAYVGVHLYQSAQSNPEVEEHRVWQQFINNNFIGRIKFEHRYRLEQRWINQDFRNRFRYRLMVFVPLNKPKIEKGTFFLGVYNEIFINGSQDFLDRNRLYAAFGYQFNKSTGIQVGWLNQRLTSFGKGYLQLGLSINPDFSKLKTSELGVSK